MELQQLVEQIADLTGAELPEMLRDDAPVLTPQTLSNGDDFYLIGLIGGKDVGKSALVNALSGRELSPSSSHGQGTSRVIAYAHHSQVERLKVLLDREAPDRHDIITHGIDALARQVLLDLPDIDSRYGEHVRITRRLLRHMLYPLWIVSVEKYADLKPRQLLAEVADGNAPDNFIFCLNKVDQVIAREGRGAADELREDYAARLTQNLQLAQPPTVRLISATHPDDYDLPSLRKMLAQGKSSKAIEQSRHLASDRRSQTLTRWVARQDLPAHLQRLDHLHAQARSILEDRVTGPLLQEVLPQLLEDPSWRAGLADAVMDRRMARWPIVNLLHPILAPLTSAARTVVGKTTAVVSDAQAIVERALSDGSAPLPSRIESAFAHLQQTSPSISALYADNKLWESMPAHEAAGELHRRLSDALTLQRDELRRRADRSWGFVGWILRWLATFGVAIWFIFRPIFQPLLHHESFTLASFGWALLSLLQADFLLITGLFLAFYYLLLWLILRRHTHWRIARLLARRPRGADPRLDLSLQAIQWGDELLEPLAARQQKLQELIDQIPR